MKISKILSPMRIIVLAFFCTILLGTFLLTLPVSLNSGVDLSFVDAFFTATSAVCVTGLTTVDTLGTFSAFGRSIIAALIQLGGFGVASMGVGIIVFSGRHVSFKERQLVSETWNVSSNKGVLTLLKAVVAITVFFEGAGTVAGFFVFSRYFPPLRALQSAMFHSISAFNNAGFDMLGGSTNLIPYANDAALNILTAVLIVMGGIGFLVIIDVLRHFRTPKRLLLQTKIVLLSTAVLLVLGTVLYKLTAEIPWLGAFFHSVSARTAGFFTYDMGNFGSAALFLTIVLMFIGASPGSTGGGIKTTTFFVLIEAVRGTFANHETRAFRRKIPSGLVSKAFTLITVGVSIVICATFVMCLLQPDMGFLELMFETVSAFGTVGLTTGITSSLGTPARLFLPLIMFTGRLGPLTMLAIWSQKPPSRVSYPEENISIG